MWPGKTWMMDSIDKIIKWVHQGVQYSVKPGNKQINYSCFCYSRYLLLLLLLLLTGSFHSFQKVLIVTKNRSVRFSAIPS